MTLIRTNAIQTVAGKPILNSTGSILQVVSFTSNAESSTTSSTFQPSFLTATITPSSSTNKILIRFQAWAQSFTEANHVAWTIFRNNSVNLDYSNGLLGMGNYYVATNVIDVEGAASVAWLDSPATTSATTYTVYYKSYNNSGSVAFGGARMSSIVLKEVSA
jgi:hypothetical protein